MNNTFLQNLFKYFTNPNELKKFIKNRRYTKYLKKTNSFEYTAHIWRYHGARIGKDSLIMQSVIFAEPYLIEIGDNVIIAGGVKLLTHDGSPMIFRKDIEEKYIYGRIVIGNNVFIGMDSIIMPGINIGDNVIVGAGSVVRKNIPDNQVVMGNPATPIFKTEIIKKLIFNHRNLLPRIENLKDSDAARMLFSHFQLDQNDFPTNFHLKDSF